MKFVRFHLVSTMQPFEVEEDEWVMEPSPERWGIRITGTDDSLNSKDAINKVKDWCDIHCGWHRGNLIYFDTEAERFEFEMAWL